MLRFGLCDDKIEKDIDLSKTLQPKFKPQGAGSRRGKARVKQLGRSGNAGRIKPRLRLKTHFPCLIASCVALCLLPCAALAAELTLAWDANKESDLKGYILSYGASSGHYTEHIDVGKKTQATVSDLLEGHPYYFAVRAYNKAGLKSAFSKELAHAIVDPHHNPQPIADAGSDQFTSGGTRVTLDAKNSTDPDGSIVSYLWEQTAGTTIQIMKADSKMATFIAPDGGTAGTTLTFRLTVTDYSGLTDTDTCTVQVTKDVVVDSDGDGVPDDRDEFPLDPDEQVDTDGDGEGNNTDTDDDNDGMPDAWELAHQLNPLKDDAAEDPDGDGVNNLNEFECGTAPNHYEGNLEPRKPILLSPGDGETIGLTPVLSADEFDDPDINDVHGKTQWLIVRAFDDVCVFDVTTDASLTALIVPKQILEEDTEYIWKIRYFDNHSSPSDWSEASTFITYFDDNDGNGDGIPDIQEVTDTFDLDENGIPDKDQNDMKCIQLEGRSTQIGISIREDDKILSLTALESKELGELFNAARYFDQETDLPYGLIRFRLLVSQPGDEVTVTLYLSEAAPPDGTWYKYDPVNDVWYDYSAYTEFSDNRKRIYLALMDGGFGDADGIANGIIVDPLALSVPSLPPAATTDNPDNSGSETGSGGGGGGVGCFVTASGQDFPTDRHQAGRRSHTILAIGLILAMVLFSINLFKPINHINFLIFCLPSL